MTKLPDTLRQRAIEDGARAIRDARALPGTNPVAKLSDVDWRASAAAFDIWEAMILKLSETGE